MNRTFLMTVFWILLVAFFSWDWAVSAPISLRDEPPVVAVGSGQAPQGAHCAATF